MIDYNIPTFSGHLLICILDRIELLIIRDLFLRPNFIEHYNIKFKFLILDQLLPQILQAFVSFLRVYSSEIPNEHEPTFSEALPVASGIAALNVEGQSASKSD